MLLCIYINLTDHLYKSDSSSTARTFVRAVKHITNDVDNDENSHHIPLYATV